MNDDTRERFFFLSAWYLRKLHFNEPDAWRGSWKSTLWSADISEKHSMFFYEMSSLEGTTWFETQKSVAYFEHTHTLACASTHLAGPPGGSLQTAL